MAKIVGYSERLRANFFDSFNPRRFPQDMRVRLFSGNEAERDTSFSVFDITARTNVEATTISKVALAAWHAWLATTNVTLIVGCRPVIRISLDAMIARTYYAHMSSPLSSVSSDGQVAGLADQLAIAYDSTIMDRLGPHPVSSDRMSDEESQRWISAARAALREFHTPAYAHIPERQSWGVEVETEHRALSAMIEAMPTNVAPETLVWIHLIGVTVREVAIAPEPIAR